MNNQANVLTQRLVLLTLVLCLGILSACSGGESGDSNSGGINNIPIIEGNPAVSIRAEHAYVFTPTASDDDGDNLSFSITNKPDWLNFDTFDGTLSGTPEITDYGKNPDITITVSDGKAAASLTLSVEVQPILLNRKNFTSEGIMTPTADGFQSQGTLVMNIGGEEKRFEDADLQLTFDAEGNLIDLVGETIVPKEISDNLSIDAAVKTTVGLFTGAEINANPDLGITLKDDFLYFVYYFSQSLDVTIGDPSSPGTFDSITLATPLSGAIVLITDPADIFTYYFAAIPFVGEAGVGLSDNGYIPFVPQLDYPELDSFDGHSLEKGSFSLGIKIFDLLTISGTRITHQPSYTEIDLSDPLASPIEYKMGINGDAEFALSVLGIGLFSFDLAKTSATLDVGLDRQQMAMQTVIAPDISWVPSWFQFVPATETVGDWFVNGKGEFNATLSSTFETLLPKATLTGSMELTPDAVTLAGTVGSGDKKMGISAVFGDNLVEVKIDVYADFSGGIRDTVTTALDNKLDELQDAFDSLQQATANFELELSLNGLRTAIPAIVDAALPAINAVPGSVRNAVDTAVVNYVNNYEVCAIICTNPLDPLVDENKLGNDKGEVARKIAADAIKPIVSALTILKNIAKQANDDIFRAAIKSALQKAYNARTFSKKITISHKFPLVGTITVYNKTITKPVIPKLSADKIKLALDNVDNIEISSNIKISAQQIFDALPVESAINTAKQEVDQGLAQIPTLDGVGYTVETTLYTAYAILDGKRYEVNFNVLDPAELAAGIGDLIADQLL